jgi:uncharacterized membrane protein
MTGAFRLSASGFAVAALLLTSVAAAAAQQTATQPAIPITTPPNSLEVSTLYPSVVVDKMDKVTISVNVTNGTTEGKKFDLVANGPTGWEPILRSRGFVVREMFLGPGKSETIDFQVTPPQSAEPKDYQFLVKALGPGGAELSNLPITVAIQDKPIGGVKLVTQYPQLRGPSKNKFQFKLDLTNDAAEERTYSLTANAPQGWQVTVKPSYEDKQITSISMKANESKTIDVEIQPQERAPAGDYTVKVLAAAGNQRAEADLNIVLTGTFEMTLGTSSGRLNAQATAGQASPFSLLVTNTGSAPLEKVNLSSSKPDGWEVKFDPETVDSLAPGATREVSISVKPSARAIAGDYMLSVTASNPQSSKSVDIRTTVDTPTYWGWIGAGVIVLVLGGLYAIFHFYGRR